MRSSDDAVAGGVPYQLFSGDLARALLLNGQRCREGGVGCAVELHTQDDRIVKVTSPTDSSVTEGHLCIKGRFGFEFVNNRPAK